MGTRRSGSRDKIHRAPGESATIGSCPRLISGGARTDVQQRRGKMTVPGKEVNLGGYTASESESGLGVETGSRRSADPDSRSAGRPDWNARLLDGGRRLG